jgi:hypothetical protein
MDDALLLHVHCILCLSDRTLSMHCILLLQLQCLTTTACCACLTVP